MSEKPRKLNRVAPPEEIAALTVERHALIDSELVGDATEPVVFFMNPSTFRDGSPKRHPQPDAEGRYSDATPESARKENVETSGLVSGQGIPLGYKKRCDKIALDGPDGYTFDVRVRVAMNEPLVFTLTNGIESAFPVYHGRPPFELRGVDRIDVTATVRLKKDQAPPDPASKVRVLIVGPFQRPVA